jgi:serine/threonine protein kinase
MLLNSEARLGPYEIVAPLGSGGMGEVYRARDTRLDRTVAIKILPAGVERDIERHERFRREARAISRLTHPHICTLYDVGEQDGVDFLVMEYLAGETLAHRLLRGPLPLEEVLRIGGELGAALDAAHREGVTHRDLKPANVMLTPGGAKILDFGLAKWHGADSDNPISAAATVNPALTQLGTVVGTIQYMAPEQVEGKPADARSDLFALGAILYEMTTGRKAFEGTSPASVMSAILSTTPTPVATLVPMTPPALDRLIRKSLAKDPDKRWQTAADLRDELEWLTDDPGQGGALPSTASLVAGTNWKRIAWYSMATTTVLAVIASLLAFVHLRTTPPEHRLVRLYVPPPDGVTYGSFGGTDAPPVVSPDGRQVAFVAHRPGDVDFIWLRPLDGLTGRALPGTDRASPNSPPFWSPDSQSLGFFAEGKLKRIDIAGGPPLVIADAPSGRGGSWNEQGTILFSPNIFSPLHRVSATGGQASAVTKLGTGENSHRWPVFLPDGRHFLFLNRSISENDQSGTDVGSLDSPEIKRVLTSAHTVTNVAYATGQLVFERRGTLLAAPFDPDRFVVTGSPKTVVENVAPNQGQGYLAPFSVSANGVLIYRQAAGPAVSQLEWFDRTGRRIGTIASPAIQGSPSLSPDGTRVAIIRGSDVWLVGDGGASRLTFDGVPGSVYSLAPVWSPDGRWIAFGRSGLGRRGLFRKAASGSTEAEELATGYGVTPTDWSRDGRFIVYVDYDAKTGLDLWALPVEGNRQRIPLVRSDGADTSGQLSPDGQWLAYSSDVTGRREVFIQRFPAAHGKLQVSTTGGREPRWRQDGSELYYVADDKHVIATTVKRQGENLEIGPQQSLFDLHVAGFGEDQDRNSYTLTHDGQRFLVNTNVSDASQPIVVMLNWQEELKQRVGTR